jgi:uncharacterized membrane protein
MRAAFGYRKFARDRRANFAVMTALCAPIAIALAALAIDEGSLYTERRAAQALVDLAAITAAANIDKAEAAALATFEDNGLPSVSLVKASSSGNGLKHAPVIEVVKGHYVADSTKPFGSRFQAGVQPYNAVKVSLSKKGTLFFGSAIMDPPTIRTTAIAGTQAQATFSVGSRLAKVEGGILNALLGALVGGNLSLSVMDYNALIAADVSALAFLDALAVQLNATAGTYDQLLQSKATVGQIVTALANTAALDQPSRLALQAIAARSTVSALVPLKHLIDLGPVGRLGLGQRPAGLSVDAGVLGMLTAAGALANGSRQIDLALGATVPGLLSAKLDLAVGEPMQSSSWLAVGEAGTVVRTAQTRVRLVATVGSGASNLGGGIKLLSVKLPLHVEVAHAEAKLTDITCPSGRPDSVRVSVSARPGIASLRLAESNGNGFADFSKPQSFHEARIAEVSVNLLLIALDLLGVNGYASVTVGNNNPATLTFDRADIAAGRTKTVSTHNITQSLTVSLINNLSLSVNALGLGLDVTGLLATVKPAVVAALNTVTEPVDKLLYNVLAALGVGLGQADVRVTGATCGRAVLVQ